MTEDEYTILLARARSLGTAHARAGTMPYAPGTDEPVPDGYQPWHAAGYTSYVFWDAGSARLLDELGVPRRSPSSDDWGQRRDLTYGYCQAYAEASCTPWDTSS